jgi:aspartyl-tRNA(Asn)/glutamyl-tRNA(Gln) amidotransferase subunit C
MALEKSDVENIAHLARLAIDEADIPDYANSLSSILDLVAQMDGVNTQDVTPMAHPMEAAQRLREDVVTETNQREHFQEHAPAVENGLFLVPKVIE